MRSLWASSHFQRAREISERRSSGDGSCIPPDFRRKFCQSEIALSHWDSAMALFRQIERARIPLALDCSSESAWVSIHCWIEEASSLWISGFSRASRLSKRAMSRRSDACASIFRRCARCDLFFSDSLKRSRCRRAASAVLTQSWEAIQVSRTRADAAVALSDRESSSSSSSRAASAGLANSGDCGRGVLGFNDILK